MACERYLNAINELVDGTLGPLRAAELTLHLESCEGCTKLAADLREIARTARSLDDLEPPARVWTQVVDQLRREGRVPPSARSLARPNYTMLALAATLVLSIGASLLFLMSSGRSGTIPVDRTATVAAPASDPMGNSPEAGAVEDIDALAKQTDATEQSVEDWLERAENTPLDPNTREELKKQGEIIRSAMAESRKALAEDPNNVAARESFYGLLRQKVRFLQDAIALMNEIRQGDAAGAAAIVESGKS